jgi:hypothetical protein
MRDGTPELGSRKSARLFSLPAGAIVKRTPKAVREYGSRSEQWFDDSLVRLHLATVQY